jgi:hypothetical protein
MAISVLEQDEIDSLVSQYNKILPASQDTAKFDNSNSKEEQPILRMYQQIFPILYYGEKEPNFYNLETICEKWNRKENRWEYYCKSGKMISKNRFITK